MKLHIFLCIFRIYISSCNLRECWCLFSSISTTDKSTFFSPQLQQAIAASATWRMTLSLSTASNHALHAQVCPPNCPFLCDPRPRFTEPTRVHTPNGSSIGSVQPFLYGPRLWPTDWHTHTLLHLWHWRWAASIHYCFASAVVATEFKQATASSSASYKIVRPPSNLINGHDSQYGPWSGGLHMSRLVTVSPHMYMEALRVPWPVRKRFNSDREQRVRSKPGCRELGSATIAQLVTEAWPVLFPLWVHVYRRQIQPGVMLWRKSLRWVAIG